jgi:hypothetical protein
MFGKRQDFWSDLGNSLLDAVTDTANSLLSGNFGKIDRIVLLKTVYKFRSCLTTRNSTR